MRASRRASPALTVPAVWAAATASSKTATKGIEHAPELVGMGLGQTEVFAYEGGGIGETSLDGEEPEQPDDDDAEALERIGLGVDHGGQCVGTPSGVVLEQRHEQFVLAGEAAVEALERRARGGHHLGHGEVGAHLSPT